MNVTVGTISNGATGLHLPGTLRALVLLAGSFRANHLGACLGRSILNLPISGPSSLIRQWGLNAGDLAQAAGIEKLPMRVLLDHLAPTLRADEDLPPTVNLQAERDRFDYRGSGGVLHDITGDYQDEDFILVANAASILLESLPALVALLALEKADVAIHAQCDGTPSGIMLIRCRCLRQISAVGFVDMKEQALPAIAKNFRVSVVLRDVQCLAVRSLPDYLSVLSQQAHWKQGHLLDTRSQGGGLRGGGLALKDPNPFGEDWQLQFALVETGALVHKTARIHNAVVLAGAAVDAQAVVVRSIIGNGGVVKRGQMVVNQIIGSDGERR